MGLLCRHPLFTDRVRITRIGQVMIHDSLDNLALYKALLPSLDRLEDLLFSYASEDETFQCNRKVCTLFSAMEEGCQIACSWREEPLSRDVLAVVDLHPGFFVLLLPGERFLFKGSGKCRVYNLE